MNKNSRKRLKLYRKACKKSGKWPTKGFKARKRPYPKVTMAQRFGKKDHATA